MRKKLSENGLDEFCFFWLELQPAKELPDINHVIVMAFFL
jgi:hypothetical protein